MNFLLRACPHSIGLIRRRARATKLHYITSVPFCVCVLCVYYHPLNHQCSCIYIVEGGRWWISLSYYAEEPAMQSVPPGGGSVLCADMRAFGEGRKKRKSINPILIYLFTQDWEMLGELRRCVTTLERLVSRNSDLTCFRYYTPPAVTQSANYSLVTDNKTVAHM